MQPLATHWKLCTGLARSWERDLFVCVVLGGGGGLDVRLNLDELGSRQAFVYGNIIRKKWKAHPQPFPTPKSFIC